MAVASNAATTSHRPTTTSRRATTTAARIITSTVKSYVTVKATPKPNTNSSAVRHLTTGDWVGVGIGVAAVVALIVILIFLCCCGVIGWEMCRSRRSGSSAGIQVTDEESSAVAERPSKQTLFRKPPGPPPGWEERKGPAQ